MAQCIDTVRSNYHLRSSFLPFGGHLRGDNRWIKLSEQIPWELVEEMYVSKLQTDFGAPAHSARMAFGSLLIKERLGLSDVETVAQITENPYLQYFIGLKTFQKDAPFDSSQMVHFRKRFSAEAIDRINEAIAVGKIREKLNENDTPPNASCSSQKGEPEQPKEPTKNLGKLLVDATCTAVSSDQSLDGKLFVEFIALIFGFLISKRRCKKRIFSKNIQCMSFWMNWTSLNALSTRVMTCA